MKSIKYTALLGDLNAGEVQIDLTFNDEFNVLKIPVSIVFKNNTGADVGILYIDSDEELTLRTNRAEYFDFIPLESGQTSGKLPSSVKYIILTILDGTATSDLNLWTLGSQ